MFELTSKEFFNLNVFSLLYKDAYFISGTRFLRHHARCHRRLLLRGLSGQEAGERRENHGRQERGRGRQGGGGPRDVTRANVASLREPSHIHPSLSVLLCHWIFYRLDTLLFCINSFLNNTLAAVSVMANVFETVPCGEIPGRNEVSSSQEMELHHKASQNIDLCLLNKACCNAASSSCQKVKIKHWLIFLLISRETESLSLAVFDERRTQAWQQTQAPTVNNTESRTWDLIMIKTWNI